MPKTITIEIPEWADEELIKENITKLLEIEKGRRDIVSKIAKKLELDDKDLEEFEKFREDLWRKEAKSFFSL